MIPEIKITCNGKIYFFSNITVQQYKKYLNLMDKNTSESRKTAMFFNMKIIQEVFDNQIPLEDLQKTDVIELLTVAKGIHFVMQNIISEKLTQVIGVEEVEKEKSGFDEYDIENGYEEEKEESIWQTCGEIVDRFIKIAIRLLKNSYSQCMKEDIVELLDYIKFELDNLNENT